VVDADSAPPTSHGRPTAEASVAASPTTVGLPTDLTDPACGEVPPALAGKWTTTIRPDELPPELFDADTGVFVMTLGPGHYMRIDVDDDHRGSDGDLCWTDDHVVMVTDREDCAGDSLGFYAWTLRDNAVDFRTVKDDCFWRPFFTTVHIWSRSDG
jgi:hypothetical protein